MKKFLAILMAMMMLCSMMAVAVAEVNTDASFDKVYSVVNPDVSVTPADTFTFSFEALSLETEVINPADNEKFDTADMPTIGSISVEFDEDIESVSGYNAETKALTKKVDVALSSTTFPAIGVYCYKVTESYDTAGVNYNTEVPPVYLYVTVVQDGEGNRYIAHIHYSNELSSNNKQGSVNNTYSAGSLAVNKTVTGNMGDITKEFQVTVKFIAPQNRVVKGNISYNDGNENKTISFGDQTEVTEVIYLKHDETITFTNIPYGVEWSVDETDAATVGDTPEYSKNIDVKAGTISAASVTSTITNNKGIDIDTGISLDDLPYIILLAVAAIGIVAMVMKKRFAADRD